MVLRPTPCRMKVGINAYPLAPGIDTYVRNVIRGLAIVDPDGDYTLFTNTPLAKDAIPGADHMRRVVVPPRYLRVPIPLLSPRLHFTEVMLPAGSASLALVREHIDVIHVQTAAPFLFPARVVVTVHDIAYERYPQFFPHDIMAKLRVRVPLTIRHAAAVLTVSEFSKQDIIRRYRVPPEKVTVAYLGPSGMFHPIHEAGRLAAVRERYGTGEQFILYVGDLQPRKNLVTLIKSYVQLRRINATRHRLVLVGRKSWLSDDIFAAARASGYADELIFTGYVPDEDLVALYNAADLFVYPPIFEGFGLPPLEAMACGTPVVTSNTSSLPEVVSDAALTVDPLDVETLASTILAVLTDRQLHADLSMRGLRRAKDFSWEATARIILGVYQDVYNR